MFKGMGCSLKNSPFLFCCLNSIHALPFPFSSSSSPIPPPVPPCPQLHVSWGSTNPRGLNDVSRSFLSPTPPLLGVRRNCVSPPGAGLGVWFGWPISLPRCSSPTPPLLGVRRNLRGGPPPRSVLSRGAGGSWDFDGEHVGDFSVAVAPRFALYSRRRADLGLARFALMLASGRVKKHGSFRSCCCNFIKKPLRQSNIRQRRHKHTNAPAIHITVFC